jgi:transposase InsO family protein
MVSSAAHIPIHQVVTIRLTKTNFLLWRAQLLPHLRGAQLMGFLDGSNPAPTQQIASSTDANARVIPNPAYERWFSGLLSSMIEDVLGDVMTVSSSKEAWDILKNMYSSASRARIVQIRMDLATIKKRDLSAADYFCKIKSYASDLAAAAAPLREDEKVTYLLAGLGPEYDSFVIAMTTKSEALTFDDIYAHFLSYEARQLQHQAKTRLNVGTMANYAGRGGSQHRGRGRGNSRGRSSFHGPEHTGPTAHDPCQICGKLGHTALKCWHRMDKSYQHDSPSAAVAATSSYHVDRNWYSDTGATDHITSELDRLAMREPYRGNDTVQVSNDASLQIKHLGSCSINTDTRPLALNNVLHVPQISKHLLSIHKLTRDNDVFFEFRPSHFFIKDRATQNLLLEGKCESGLYPIKPADLASVKQAHLSCSACTSQWHARFGHPSVQVVRSILSLHRLPCREETSLSTVCNACQLAKSHQLPYHSSTFHATSPLELIYSDVWGPAPVSIDGYKYYISFIDAFSKFKWIYLMHDRTDARRIFLQFQAHVERRLNKNIKCVQSDWGGEYKKLHNRFFTSLGIGHRVSCPHTHQQNGLAERKHRHIVETGLALLAHAAMPLKFWDEAFTTATYLINRLPTRVIDNLSPLQRLFQTPPNYSLLKIFGCACWPHLRPYNRHKLSFRSKPCVFIGYSSLHKGYKCLDMDSGRVYISRDVVFDEALFPFSTPSYPVAESSQGSTRDIWNNNHLHNLFPANTVAADRCAVPPPADPAQDSGQVPLAEEPAPDFSHDVVTNMVAAGIESMPGVQQPVLAQEMSPTAVEPSQAIAADSSASPAPGLAPSSTGLLHGAVSMAPPTEVAPASTSPAGPKPHPYGTRLQHAIRKPKLRTDGTVSYSVERVSTVEPHSHVQALKHPLWR